MASDEVVDLIQENEAAQVAADSPVETTSNFNFEARDNPKARNMLGKQVKGARQLLHCIAIVLSCKVPMEC